MMSENINLLLLISVCFSIVALFNNVHAYKALQKNGHCVLRGICGETDFGGISCATKRVPSPLKRVEDNARAYAILETMCPHLVSGNNDPIVCCDADQLENMYNTMYNYMELELERCPSCRSNFEKIFCNMICSSNQSNFLSVKKVKKNEFGNYMATEIDYYISESFAVGAFDSCKNVKNANGKILSQMCDNIDANDCTVHEWFNYLGKRFDNGGLMAYQINFHIYDKPNVRKGRFSYNPMDSHYYKCSESLDGDDDNCGCDNCPEVCEAKDIIQEKRSEIMSSKIREKRQSSGTCLMKGVCGEGAFGAVPCVSNEGPEMMKDPVALEELREMCPHLVDNPNVCCTEDQIISLNRTFEMIGMFIKDCPSCVRNFEKIFCHLSCSPEQQNFMKITKTEKNDDGKDVVKEVEYYANEDWGKGVFDSCKGVHRLGFNILDHYCKPYKEKECDYQKFLNFIGGDAEHFGHSPFETNFIFSNDETITADGKQYKPAKLPFYQCSDVPHTGEGKCPCTYCEQSCDASDPKAQIVKEMPKYKTKTKREDASCVMIDVCGEGAFGVLPCLRKSPPVAISDPIALEELKEMCPHLATGDQPMVCCTEQQIIALNHTFEMLSMFLRDCPSCIRNFEKMICHLSCGTDQSKYMKVTKTEKNENGDEMVTEVDYYVNDDWAKGIYDSCKGVHRLGFNVFDHYCKPYKSKDCDHQKFLQFIGADERHFGHSPFEINFRFSNDEKVIADGIEYVPVKQSYYKCSDNPHTGEGPCPCRHCDDSCSESDPKVTINKLLPQYKGKKSKRQTSGMCMMSGICGETATGKIPCVVSKPPTQTTELHDEALKDFKQMCPHLNLEQGICCNEEQIIHLNKTFEVMGMYLKVCPSCLRNLEEFSCHLVCSSMQEKFIKIVRTQNNDDGQEMALELEYYIDDDWAKGIYESCKGIHLNGMNIQDVYCKPFGKKDCDHVKWFTQSHADKNHGGNYPFEVYIRLHKTDSVTIDGATYNPVKQKFTQCSEPTASGEDACACEHCEQSCSRRKREDLESEVKEEINNNNENYCVFNGICGKGARGGSIPCAETVPPKSLEDQKAIELLRKNCPELAMSDNPLTCCDASAVIHLDIGFKLPAKLGLELCPSCLHNFRKALCQLACSPRQNQFVRVSDITISESKTQVNGVQYFVDNAYAQGLFDSCKDIKNGTVLNMMCGKWGRKKECTPQRWFDFMGLSAGNGGYSPFQMDVILTNDDRIVVNGTSYYPMNEKAVPCNEIPAPGSASCGCANCNNACV